MAVNKPAGLLVAPDRWDKQRENLMGLLHQGISAHRPWATARQLTYLANAHRLDYNTSGVLLLARTKPVLTILAALLREHAVRKTYAVLVHNCPESDTMTIDYPIGPNPRTPGRSVIDQSTGKPAQTAIHVEEKFGRYTLLTAQPATGRLHQIRVHLQGIGCPVVGDPPYGGKALLLSRLKPHYKVKPEGEKPMIDRPALHAQEIAFTHPQTQAPIVIRAEWPKDFTVAVKYLRKFG